jgi:hypothetical protein
LVPGSRLHDFAEFISGEGRCNNYRDGWRLDVNIDERRPGLAMELVKMQVDVVVKAGPQAASAAQILPLKCFQLPLMRFRFIFISLKLTACRHRPQSRRHSKALPGWQAPHQ